MENGVNKKYIIGIIVAVALVGGGAALFMMMNNNKSISQDGIATGAPTTNASNTSEQTSLKDLLAKTSPTTCVVTSTSDTVDTTGVVYVANGKMRSDFTNIMKSGPDAGETQIAHMIVDSDAAYMWGSGEMKMGIKIAKKDVFDVVPSASGNSPANQAAIDINEKSDFHCEDWTVDQSLFTLPTDTQFQDMSAMMKSLPQAGTPTSASADMSGQTGMTTEQMAQMCGACDSAGEGKEQCRAALGCK